MYILFSIIILIGLLLIFILRKIKSKRAKIIGIIFSCFLVILIIDLNSDEIKRFKFAPNREVIKKTEPEVKAIIASAVYEAFGEGVRDQDLIVDNNYSEADGIATVRIRLNNDSSKRYVWEKVGEILPTVANIEGLRTFTIYMQMYVFNEYEYDNNEVDGIWLKFHHKRMDKIDFENITVDDIPELADIYYEHYSLHTEGK